MKEKDNPSHIKNMIYYNIDEKGCIEEEYNIKNEAGIYINRYTNECYVGLSNNIPHRLKRHKYNVNNYKKDCPKLCV